MPLTDKEQELFDRMVDIPTDLQPDSRFLKKLADVLFELTGNVNLKLRMDNVAEKL